MVQLVPPCFPAAASMHGRRAGSTKLAKPKSHRHTDPSDPRRKFSNFRSACVIPASWHFRTAFTICRNIDSMVAEGKQFFWHVSPQMVSQPWLM